MDIFETVKRLSEAGGVSGSEAPAADIAEEYLKKYDCEIRREQGGITAVFNSGKSPRTVIDVHIDRVGFVVTGITDEGFLKFAPAGGIDARILPSRHVVIFGRETVRGIICSVPPHLKSGKDKVRDIADMYIDTRMSGEQARECISAGDTVTFDVPVRKMTGQRISGAAFDDRCGAAAVLYALEKTDLSRLRGELDVVFAYQEELGMRGAEMAAYTSDCDRAIAVDVSFAVSPGEKEQQCGRLGKGCMIGTAPSLDREMFRRAVSIARENGIPYQIEVMDGTTGTDADRYSVSRGGAKTLTLSVPLRYMHTSAEVIDIDDVISTGDLLAAYIGEEC